MTIREILNKHLEKLENPIKINSLTREQKIQNKIAEKYSLADEIALLNNYNMYLQDNALIKYKQEYDEYCAYRLKVKEEIG